MKAGNDIYAYGGVIYGNLQMLKKVVKGDKSNTLADSFMKAWGLTELTDEAIDAVTTDLAESKNGFAIYSATTENDDNKYYMYYVYYNRHNNNGDNNAMGPMEFATVRNNIYKLAVTAINRIGHPGNPGDDPDPEKPDDPDESSKVYFRVQVRVLPWVVRVNNIIL